MPLNVTPPPGSLFHLFHRQGEEYVAYSWQNLDVILWLGSATGPGARSLNQLTRTRMREGRKYSAIHTVLAGAGLPDEEGRKELNLQAERSTKSLGCLVAVIERQGFAGSAIRAFVSGVFALTAQEAVRRVVASMEDAAAWLPEAHARTTGVRLDPTELRGVLLGIRALVP